MINRISKIFKEIKPDADYCSIRYVSENGEILYVRQDVLQPVVTYKDRGAMITAIIGDGMGYAGTSDISINGLKKAADRAVRWAKAANEKSIVDFSSVKLKPEKGKYNSVIETPWNKVTIEDKIQFLSDNCKNLKIDKRIVDWNISLMQKSNETVFVSSDDSEIYQNFSYIIPDIRVIANEGPVTQTRSLHGRGAAKQGGIELLYNLNVPEKVSEISDDAIKLLSAENCPSGKMDILIDPDQMILQIHESIGHPLELDRILGDERNYAGTSFVTPEMFGSFRYGSELLNITFDPSIPNEPASYAFDDEGQKAEKKYIIEKGILKRALGSNTSQKRSGIPGVSNSRSCSWNRPPIDRMANLNLEPGVSTKEEMIKSIAYGVYVKSNKSWSIDDSRNKFQFGCEWGQLIENGELTDIVKNPNYRGISKSFWRNLKMTGNKDTFDVFGTPHCGKGEPNQVIMVGHASPLCLFENVEVFGGE